MLPYWMRPCLLLYIAMSLTVCDHVSYCMEPCLLLYAGMSLTVCGHVSYCMQRYLLLYAAMSLTVCSHVSFCMLRPCSLTVCRHASPIVLINSEYKQHGSSIISSHAPGLYISISFFLIMRVVESSSLNACSPGPWLYSVMHSASLCPLCSGTPFCHPLIFQSIDLYLETCIQYSVHCTVQPRGTWQQMHQPGEGGRGEGHTPIYSPWTALTPHNNTPSNPDYAPIPPHPLIDWAKTLADHLWRLYVASCAGQFAHGCSAQPTWNAPSCSPMRTKSHSDKL